MVLQKIAQYGDVPEASLHSVMGASQPSSVGVTRELECLDKWAIHWEVEDGVQGFGPLKLRRKVDIISVDFTNAENASTGTKAAPEATVHVFGSWIKC